MWRVEDENGLNGEVGPSEFYASRHNKDSPRQNPVKKSSEPSVTQLKTGKSWSRLTGNPHQRTSDIRIGTEPKWANIVWRGIQTVHGQEWLDVWPSEVQKALHVVRHGTVVSLKMSGSQYLCTKQSMSGGYVAESVAWSLDAMVGGRSRRAEGGTRATVIYPSVRRSSPRRHWIPIP